MDVQADHTLTDPPYEPIHHAAKRRARNVRTDGRARISPEVRFAAMNERQAVTDAIREVTAGWFLAFCTPEGIAPWRDAIEASGLRYKRACFWCKTNPAPQFNGQGPGFGVEPFVTAWCGKGVSRWNGGGRHNWFTHAINQSDREGTHPTEKPLSLMLELIELFTRPGDTILDPFMGSGTTGVAALALNRQFIGIDDDPKSYALAKGRLLGTFTGDVERRGIIAKLTGSDKPGPLFENLAM